MSWSRIDQDTATASKLKPTALIQSEAAAQVEGKSLQDNIIFAKFTLSTATVTPVYEMRQHNMWMSEVTNMHRFAILGRLRNPVQQLFMFDSKYSNLGKVMNYTLFFYQVRVICLRVREICHCC